VRDLDDLLLRLDRHLERRRRFGKEHRVDVGRLELDVLVDPRLQLADADRLLVLYNDTPTSPADPLIGWWDYGSSISVNDGETFTVDIVTNLLTIA
jgi:hypothetical protein